MSSKMSQFELTDSSAEDLTHKKRPSSASSDSSESSELFNEGLESDSKVSSGSGSGIGSVEIINPAGKRDKSRNYGTAAGPVKFETAKVPNTALEFTPSGIHAARTRTEGENRAFLETLSPIQAALSSAFGRIDRKQFEQYLKEPEYLRIYKKQSKIKQFRRLFLAQELSTEPGALERSAGSSNTLSSLTDGSSSGSGHNPRAIWATKFSRDGKYMATGGKDCTLRVWKVISSPLERNDLQISTGKPDAKQVAMRKLQSGSTPGRHAPDSEEPLPQPINLYAPVFHPLPYRTFQQHTQDILDLDWSKNGFILTTSMDKTARLWHCDRLKAIKTFTHPDFVTCGKFHPNDDRFFISGCLDHTCRLWSILDHKVSFEYYCGDIITAMDVSMGDGKYTAIGTFNGHISILYTRGLELMSTFHVLETTREQSKKVPQNGPKITGIEFFKNEADNDLRILVTSNDSRVRVLSIKQRRLLEVLKGFVNTHTQISAHLMKSQEKQNLVIASSENKWVYCWRLESSLEKPDPESVPETSEHLHPNSLRGLLRRSLSIGSNHSAESRKKKDCHPKGTIPCPSRCKIDQSIKNSHYVAFHAHHHTVTTTAVAPIETAKTLALSDDLIYELTMALSETNDDVVVMGEQPTKSLLQVGRQAQSKQEMMERRYPSVIEAIGSIVISTDSSGVIRVFRSDISTNVRKRVLKCSAKHFQDEECSQGDCNVDYPHSHWGLLGFKRKAAHSTLMKSKHFGSSNSVKSLASTSLASNHKE
ncbi:LAME_0G17128g1_1 [Lachancea meyersii CBS 8951]|uniref:LAME_0G17128g1_1 n=1 Tax=Lachancea meyersii CBS 8951 TaxID=1266667 RepID=A0A1G4KBC9_9SACH|nr:LAME_0G17128g1_1 [Lachancea meyersii CBS 8951]